MRHPFQHLQVEGVHAVSCHTELIHGSQLLQHPWNVGELIEGQTHVAELMHMLQFIGKGLEKVAVQQKCLQAIKSKGGEGRAKKVSDLLKHISFL